MSFLLIRATKDKLKSTTLYCTQADFVIPFTHLHNSRIDSDLAQEMQSLHSMTHVNQIRSIVDMVAWGNMPIFWSIVAKFCARHFGLSWSVFMHLPKKDCPDHLPKLVGTIKLNLGHCSFSFYPFLLVINKRLLFFCLE